MWDVLRRWSGVEHSGKWAAAVLLFDAALTLFIITEVAFTNVDWEAYMAEVAPVLNGDFDYSHLSGPTGPIAYPAGFVFLYGALSHLTHGGTDVRRAQLVFAAVQLATTWAVGRLYRAAGAPGWLLALAVLSKRVHSILVLRLFNDGPATLLLYLALLCVLRRRWCIGSLVFSLAISVKMHPIFYAPAIGLVVVLRRGWLHTAHLVTLFVVVQAVLASPFLVTNPWAYLTRAFGGPGDLQQVWSVNWKFLPAWVFESGAFQPLLVTLQGSTMLCFAHCWWCPMLGAKAGLKDRAIWSLHAPLAVSETSDSGAGADGEMSTADARTLLVVFFTCNFVSIACLRTMHFQFLVWYFHTLAFLAWSVVQPEAHRGLAWAFRCVAVVLPVAVVEICFLATTVDEVRGPDGRNWRTRGTPTRGGSFCLTVLHCGLLVALALRSRGLLDARSKDD